MTPPPDKQRPLVPIRCKVSDCEFVTTMEWSGLRHEDLPGHRMEWWQEQSERRQAERERQRERS